MRIFRDFLILILVILGVTWAADVVSGGTFFQDSWSAFFAYPIHMKVVVGLTALLGLMVVLTTIHGPARQKGKPLRPKAMSLAPRTPLAGQLGPTQTEETVPPIDDEWIP